jgi:hypothetical protein
MILASAGNATLPAAGAGRGGDADDCAGCWWKVTAAHMRILIPILAAVLGSILTFVITTETASSRQAAELQSEAKLVDELKSNTVSREVFDATIQPIKTNIGEIKTMVQELQKLKQGRSDEVIYRTYKTASN